MQPELLSAEDPEPFQGLGFQNTSNMKIIPCFMKPGKKISCFFFFLIMFKSSLPTTHPVSHMGCPQIIRVHPKMKIRPAASTPSHSHHPKSSSRSLGIPLIRARCQPYNTALLPGVTGFTAPLYAICRAAFREHPTCPTPHHSRLCTSHPHHLCIPGTKFTAPTPQSQFVVVELHFLGMYTHKIHP